MEGLAKRLQEEHARDLDPPHKNKTAATLKDSSEDVALSTPEPSASRHDEAGKALWSQREQSAKFQKMLMGRNTLPVAAQKEHIVETFSQNQVVVLSGETGCGKSTQVPAYIMESCLLRGEACKIYVTEPRRISAISLAERVSQEIGEDKGVVGKDHSLIGSAVRLENNIGKNARLVFATTGNPKVLHKPTMEGTMLSRGIIDNRFPVLKPHLWSEPTAGVDGRYWPTIIRNGFEEPAMSTYTGLVYHYKLESCFLVSS